MPHRRYSCLPALLPCKTPITLRSHLLFTAASIVLWLLLLTALRGLLLAYNHEMIGSSSTADLLEAFSNGICFDLRLIVYVSVPLLLGILIPWLMNKNAAIYLIRLRRFCI